MARKRDVTKTTKLVFVLNTGQEVKYSICVFEKNGSDQNQTKRNVTQTALKHVHDGIPLKFPEDH